MAWGLGIDRSPGALVTARRNARRNGVGERVAFAAGDWASPLGGRLRSHGVEPALHRHRRARAPLRGGPAPRSSRRARRRPGRARRVSGDPRRSASSARARRHASSSRSATTRKTAVARLAVAMRLAVRRVARDLGGRPRAVVIGRRRSLTEQKKPPFFRFGPCRRAILPPNTGTAGKSACWIGPNGLACHRRS